MPRKRPRKSGQVLDDRDGDQRAKSEPAATVNAHPLPVVGLLVFALAAIVGVGLYFFDAPDQHVQQRQQSLVFLVAPDELFAMWCGGKAAYFSVLDRWPIAVLAAAILAGAWLAGRMALIALGVSARISRLERCVFAMGVGLNLMSLYALIVGLAGGLGRWWLFVGPLVVLMIGNVVVRDMRSVRTEGGQSPPYKAASAYDNDWRWLWGLVVVAPFAMALLFGAMLPPWDYDVREYHLQTPKEWFQNGRIEFLPHNIYANMPLGSEMTALWGMALAGGKDGWWWGALAGKTVMACYSLVAAGALVAFGRRLHSLAAGVVAAVLLLTTPWIVYLAAAGYNEGPVALYALLAIYALWLAWREENLTQAGRFVLLSGFLAGSAVACKYPPVLFVVVPLAVWSFVICHLSFAAFEWKEIRWRSFCAVLFLAAAVAACGPWFVKNWVLAGNPTYPLLYSVFDGHTRTVEKDRQFREVHSPQPDQNGNRFSAFQFADQVAWNTWRTLRASLAIPPLVVVGLVFAGARRRFVAAAALWMAFVFVTWWLFTHRLDRFLVLVVPIAALVGAIGALAMSHLAWRAATLGFVACGALAHFPFVTLHPDNRYFAPLEQLRRDDRGLGVQGYHVEASHRWLNANARPGEKVLLLGDAEPFDLELPAIYNTCFDDCEFTRIFQGRTREQRLSTLREEKIAYVFCSWRHLARYRSHGNYGYTSSYPTRELVHEELIGEQKLLIPIQIDSEPELGELFRVVGRGE